MFSENTLLNKDAVVTVHMKNLVCYHHVLFYPFFGAAFVCFLDLYSCTLISIKSGFGFYKLAPIWMGNEDQVCEPGPWLAYIRMPLKSTD